MSRCPSLSSLALLVLVIPALGASPARAATFVVNSTGVTSDLNPGDGVCDDGSGPAPVCTLRAAIDEANADAVQDRIEFDIPGPGPHSIPDGGLFIYQPVVIDGYTQPGASKNTAVTGTNAVLAIMLEGDFSSGGILVHAADVELRGLWLRDPSHGDPLLGGTCIYLNAARAKVLGSRLEGCGSTALFVQGNNARIGDALRESRNLITDIPDQIGIAVAGNDAFVVNNLIGTDATGTLSLPSYDGIDLQGLRNTVTDNWIDASNVGVSLDLDTASSFVARNRIRGPGADNNAVAAGVYVAGGHDNQIGLPSPIQANANRISGFYWGVRLAQTASGNRVQGNLIGVEADGTPSEPYAYGASNNYGVWMEDASGNTIGEPAVGSSGAGNWIAFNRRGLVVRNGGGLGNDSLDNSLRANRFWAQTELNLDLGEDLSRNDDGGFPPDQDEGPNHLQNPPRISSVTRSGGTTRVQGAIAAQAGSYTLDFYSNDDCARLDPGLVPGYGQGGKFHLGEASLLASPTSAVPLTSFDVTLPLNALGNGFTAMATDATGNSSEFSACATSTQAQADLSVAVTADHSSAGVGDDVVFTVALTNAGPLTATAVAVQVPRPAGFSTWTADPAVSYDETTGQWLAGDLASGPVTTLTLTGRVASGAPNPIVVQAVAGQGSAQVDADLTNNTSSARIAVLSGAHLRLSQTAPASANPGDNVSFEIDLTNDGAEVATSVTLEGHLDNASIYESLVQVPPGAYSDALNWSLSVGSLAKGAVAHFTVQAGIDPNQPVGSRMNHTVTATTANGDPRLSTQTVGVGAVADLSVSLLWPLVVVVKNNGPDPVEGFNLEIGACFFTPVKLPDAVCSPIAGPPSCAALCVVTRRVGAPGSTSFEFEQFPPQVTATVSSADGMAFYDPHPENNAAVILTNSVCGLTGLEAVFGIGLLALVRRKLRGRALRRSLPVAALLLALWTGGAESARALPIAFVVDTAASNASVSLASPVGSASPVAVSVSGSASADVALGVNPSFGLVATSLQLTGAALAFSDASLPFANPPLFSLTFASSGLGASLSGPQTSGFPVGSGLSLFDLGGSALVFDAGAVAATGSYFGQPVDVTLDLALTPLTSVFPNNSVAQLLVVDLGGGNASLRLSFPFSAPLRITVDDLESTVTIAGTLVLNGVAQVPEPASGLLVGGGLAWLAVRRRRAGASRT